MPAALRLVVERLAQVRGDRDIFRDVSFVVAAGEALTLSGPNGAGKTTLLRTVAGLMPPDAGSIALEGGDPERTVGEQAHLVGHTNAVKPTLTVTENAKAWAAILGGTDDVSPALASVGLVALADIPARFLSAGQKRRLGLARLLLAPRPLWLLDEPTVSLDAESRDRIATLVSRHVATGGIVVAATHVPLGIDAARQVTLSAVDVAP